MHGNFPKPPDVPDYVPVAVTYASGTDLNTLGNGVDPDGGTPPAMTNELTPSDPPGMVFEDWTYDGPYGEAEGYKARPADGGTANELKMRTTFEPSHILNDDPIRNYGQPGSSHPHVFFGNPSANAYSTFSSLRARALHSTAAGGPLNGTAYWVPAMQVNGKFIWPDYFVAYYQEDLSHYGTLSKIPHGLRYVTGFDMDHGWSAMQAHVDAANAQPGTAGRYRLGNGTDFPRRHQFQCDNGTGEKVDSLADAQGNDPFPTPCQPGEQLIIDFSGDPCWDGVNLWSPGGYLHVIPQIWDSHEARWVCPLGWYRLPKLQLKVFYSHPGASGTEGYTNWSLVSDSMGAAASLGVLPGESFHADWFGAWNDLAFTLWQENCLGVNGGPGHECATNIIGPTDQLLYNNGAPTGKDPQVDLNVTYGPADPASPTVHSNAPNTIRCNG